MNRKTTICFLLLFVLFSCFKKNPEDIKIESWENVQEYLDLTHKYPDNTYCADIEYYNPKTGTRSDYQLKVEIKNGELTQINWNNGGWLDETHFTPQDIYTGSASFISDKGYNFNVKLVNLGDKNCWDGVEGLEAELQKDIEQLTCPACRGEKEANQNYCSSCQLKVLQIKQRQLYNSKLLYSNYSKGVIETKIDGEFKGWEGETIFKMMNGTIWQQDSYAYTYHYAYMPEVLLYRKSGRIYMKVEGVDSEIAVKRIK